MYAKYILCGIQHISFSVTETFKSLYDFKIPAQDEVCINKDIAVLINVSVMLLGRTRKCSMGVCTWCKIKRFPAGSHAIKGAGVNQFFNQCKGKRVT